MMPIPPIYSLWSPPVNYFCPVNSAVSQLSGPLSSSGAAQQTDERQVVSVALTCCLTLAVNVESH